MKNSTSRLTKTVATSLLACTMFLPVPAYAQNENESNGQRGNEGWQVSIAAGTIFAPKYYGDDDYQLNIIPNISVQYDDLFFASIEGIGLNVVNKNGWRIGPIAKYQFSRDEDGDNLLALGNDTDDLIGLGDVDGTIELGGFAEYSVVNFSGKVEMRQGVNGHDGFVGEAELKYKSTFPAFGTTAYWSLGPELTFGDNKYNSAYFDVDAIQSAASGLAQYDADGGLNSYGIHGSVVMPMTDHISLIGFAGYDRLSGDIADSSLVQERGSEDQAIAGILLNYRF